MMMMLMMMKPATEPVGQEVPDTAHEVIHMKGHQISTSKYTVRVGIQKIRPGKRPLRRCDRDKQVRESTKPYLSSQPTHMIIQLLVVNLVITA